jgi:hypothetical protein
VDELQRITFLASAGTVNKSVRVSESWLSQIGDAGRFGVTAIWSEHTMVFDINRHIRRSTSALTGATHQYVRSAYSPDAAFTLSIIV